MVNFITVVYHKAPDTIDSIIIRTHYFVFCIYCRTGNFCEYNLCVLVCDIILRKCTFAFLAASL